MYSYKYGCKNFYKCMVTSTVARKSSQHKQGEFQFSLSVASCPLCIVFVVVQLCDNKYDKYKFHSNVISHHILKKEVVIFMQGFWNVGRNSCNYTCNCTSCTDFCNTSMVGDFQCNYSSHTKACRQNGRKIGGG